MNRSNKGNISPYIMATEKANNGDIHIWNINGKATAFGKSATLLNMTFPTISLASVFDLNGVKIDTATNFHVEPILSHFVDMGCNISADYQSIHITNINKDRKYENEDLLSPDYWTGVQFNN